MELIGVIFEKPGTYGDFRWMIEQPEFTDALFLFNDNEEQFLLHRREPHPDRPCSPGGGNAVIRPYQCQNPPRATGIPTGAGGMGYYELSDRVRAILDRAISDIRKLLELGRYEQVFYSSDGKGGLGTGIFDVAEEVKGYVVERLQLVGHD